MLRIIATVLLTLTLTSVAVADEPLMLRPSDFAYGIPIQATGAGPLFEVAVPRAVYETVTRPDLGDMRVFNAHGEAVPFILHRPDASKMPGEWTRLALFPVHSRKHNPDEVALRVQKNPTGFIVSVHATTDGGRGAPVAFYLVDASADDRPIWALELNWKNPSSAGFSGELRVEASDDLKTWRVVAANAPLARLNHQGRLLERRRVELGSVRAKYLRLVWASPERTVALTEITAERVAEAYPAREWIQLTAASRGNQPGQYGYVLNGHMPVDQARIRLAQTDSMANAELSSRGSVTDPWRLRASGVAYRLKMNDHDLTSDAFPLSASADGDREWLLHLASPQNAPPRPQAPGSEAPALELGWIPQQVVFVARGDGPFMLAYGGRGIAPGDNSYAKWLQENAGREPRPPVAQPASLGAPQALGGDERLKVKFTARPWAKWLTWLAIAVAVFAIGLKIGRRFTS